MRCPATTTEAIRPPGQAAGSDDPRPGPPHGFEQEIDSLSTQLANSYEELSLIYQVSGGMKVNRSAGDFFRQACLDVREVMGVRGDGRRALRRRLVQAGPGALRRRRASRRAGRRSDRLADELMAVLRERKSPLLINDLSTRQALQLGRRALRGN